MPEASRLTCIVKEVIAVVSWQDFYRSGLQFAQDALEAHHEQQYGRAALHAGTALEHLAKSCLANRSPALITELKGEGSFYSLARLLGFADVREPVQPLRTVGLRGALDRLARFVTSNASKKDLMTLADLRDGTVHAGAGVELEERVLVAFVQHSDALVADLGRDRSDFWGPQLAVVNALLADAKDKTKHLVAVKFAAVQASFHRRYGNMPSEVLDHVRQIASPMRHTFFDQERADCPACGSYGIAYGDADPEWDNEESDDQHWVTSIWWDARQLHLQSLRSRARFAGRTYRG